MTEQWCLQNNCNGEDCIGLHECLLKATNGANGYFRKSEDNFVLNLLKDDKPRSRKRKRTKFDSDFFDQLVLADTPRTRANKLRNALESGDINAVIRLLTQAHKKEGRFQK